MLPPFRRPRLRAIRGVLRVLRALRTFRCVALARARALLSDVLDAAFPQRCRYCEAPLGRGGAAALCASCARGIRWIDVGCPRCGMPVLRAAPDGACGECRGRRLGFDRVFAAGVHEGALRALVLESKYRRDPAARDALVDALVRTWRGRVAPALAELDGLRAGGGASSPVVTVVPGRLWTLLRSGADPLGELAAAFCARVELPFRRLLVRARGTSRQTGLPRLKRLRNQRGAFRVRAGRRLWRRGRRRSGRQRRPALPGVVLLLDDVVTTGATVSDAARALRRAGVRRVYVLSVGRSPV